jgi:hypothetical protein
MPEPKIDFYTPATFKKVAEHVVQTLSNQTGIKWALHGIEKSNRKLAGDTRELSLNAKLRPQDPKEPWSADLYATLETGFKSFALSGAIAVDHRMRTVFEDRVSPKTVGEITHWATNLKLPESVLEGTKKQASLVERVAARWLTRP